MSEGIAVRNARARLFEHAMLCEDCLIPVVPYIDKFDTTAWKLIPMKHWHFCARGTRLSIKAKLNGKI